VKSVAGIGAPEFMTTFRNITEGITKQQLVRRSKQQQQEQLVKVQEQEQKYTTWNIPEGIDVDITSTTDILVKAAIDVIHTTDIFI